MRLACAASLLWLAAGCNKHGATPGEDAGPEGGLADGALLDARDAANPPAASCTVNERVSLSDRPGDSFDFGQAVTIAGGAILGVSRSGPGSRIASVARVAPRATPRIVDLGGVAGDDPPPRPFVRGAEVFAAGYVIEGADGGAKARAGRARRLTVFRVTDSAEPLLTIPQASDESPAFDVAANPAGSPVGGIVVWDEDAPAPDAGPVAPRGIIRAALLGADLRAVTQVATVSPEITDAERPQVAVRDGGYWVAWVARRREPLLDAAPELEAPGEDRSYRWVELLALDERGAPAGGVRRLSPATSHAAGFEITGGGARLDAAIVLDDEQGDGAGGALLHVVALAEGSPRAVTIRASGVGRGSAPRLGWAAGAPGWFAYVDTLDHTRLALLDADGAPSQADAIEPGLEESRVVASSRAPAWVLAVTPGGKGAKGGITWLSCVTSP